MSNFGWSLPAGCGTLPGEEHGEALEMTIHGVRYAYDEDGYVLVYTGEVENDYDDGYRRIGVMPWPDDDDWESALRVWVATHYV